MRLTPCAYGQVCDLPDVARQRNAAHTVGMTSAETIGQRVKRERLGRNLTQRQLADAVGVGAPHISKVEADRENPSDELLTKIADLFQLDADELMLVARRVPESFMEKLALNPGKSLLRLRQWS